MYHDLLVPSGYKDCWLDGHSQREDPGLASLCRHEPSSSRFVLRVLAISSLGNSLLLSRVFSLLFT